MLLHNKVSLLFGANLTSYIIFSITKNLPCFQFAIFLPKLALFEFNRIEKIASLKPGVVMLVLKGMFWRYGYIEWVYMIWMEAIYN